MAGGDAAPATERFERQFSGAGGRRTVVIGTETTGAIPVHLLYRDAVASAGATARGPAEKTGEDRGADAAAGAARKLNGTSASKAPDGAARLKDGRSAFGANGLTKDAGADGGPDTIAMPPVALPTGRRSAANAGTTGRRPAPPPDPRLIERPGPVLPGWAALLAGMLSLAGCAAVLHWAGAFPPEVTTLFGLGERPYGGLGFVHWALLAVSLTVALFSLGGLARGRVGHAWVLTLYGEYRGSVRSSGLVWVSPLLLRRRVDVRLRHWRSDPMPSVDAEGTALEAVVLVVWRVRDTARAVLGVANHESYLREQVEAALARVLSQIPADASASPAGGGPALELRPTLRNAEAVGDALTKTLAAECAPIGIDVFSAQPTRIEYAPEVAAAMRRRRVAALEAERRDTVLSSVVDAVDDTVQRLTMRGLVEFDDYERKALVRDLTVAFCTARTGAAETL
jgi:regulator of protease activity HflC (stomatin/prohibitin superfamily)